MVVDIEDTDKLEKNFPKRVYTLNGYNSVIFSLRSFKFCVVIDIEVTDKLGEKSKRGVASRGCGIRMYTLKWA